MVPYSSPDVRVDITLVNCVEHVFKRSGLSEETVRRLVDLVGPERLLWGPKGPSMHLLLFENGHGLYKTSTALLVDRLDFLSKQDKANMLGWNASRLLELQH